MDNFIPLALFHPACILKILSPCSSLVWSFRPVKGLMSNAAKLEKQTCALLAGMHCRTREKLFLILTIAWTHRKAFINNICVYSQIWKLNSFLYKPTNKPTSCRPWTKQDFINGWFSAATNLRSLCYPIILKVDNRIDISFCTMSIMNPKHINIFPLWLLLTQINHLKQW